MIRRSPTPAGRGTCAGETPAPQSAIRNPQSAIPGFTLVEMIAVVAIIALLLAISLPGITRVWEERKVAQAITMVRGLLASTRAQALRSSERGLFFFIDPVTGAQRVAPIVADPPRDDDPATPGFQEKDLANPVQFNPVTDALTVNRFIVAPGDIYTLPAPVRVVPRDILDPDPYGTGTPPPPYWPDADIERKQYNSLPATPGLPLLRHRNFFTMVFGPDGKLMIGRDVIIHDPDAEPTTPANRGDRTGLFVEQADKYFVNQDLDGNGTWNDPPANLDPFNAGGILLDLLVEIDGVSATPTGTGVALNFRSVDGLLVYDETVLAEIPADPASGPDGKRAYLLREGLPIYVSRLSGEVLQGPKGE